MKPLSLLFLGTAAADFSPRLKGDCADRLDRDARRASCALLGGRVLIDCGPHCPDSIRLLNLDIRPVEALVLTHLHGDHYNPDSIALLASQTRQPLKIFVREGGEKMIPDIPHTAVFPLPLLTETEILPGVTVAGLPANHDEKVFPQHLLFSAEGKSLFYGCDGAWLLNASFGYLRGRKLDGMVLDCTVGDYIGDFRLAEHNSIPMIRLMLPSLRTVGIMDDHTRVFLSHLAPSLHKPHAETQEIVSADGLTVAYDGLSVLL